MKVQGIISRISEKERDTKWGKKTATSFAIDGKWYSGGFKPWAVSEGDTVELQYEVNGRGYNDVVSITVLSKGSGAAPSSNSGNKVGGGRTMGRSFPVEPLAPERTINRQNALTNAVSFHNTSAEPATVEDIIATARKFEAYTCGDIDREEAEKMVAEMRGASA